MEFYPCSECNRKSGCAYSYPCSAAMYGQSEKSNKPITSSLIYIYLDFTITLFLTVTITSKYYNLSAHNTTILGLY